MQSKVAQRGVGHKLILTIGLADGSEQNLPKAFLSARGDAHRWAFAMVSRCAGPDKRQGRLAARATLDAPAGMAPTTVRAGESLDTIARS